MASASRIPLRIMLRAFALSIGQLGEAPVLRVFVKSFLITLVLLVALGTGLWFGTAWAVRDLIGAQGTVADIAAAVAILLAALLAWLLFRAVAIAVLGFFADEVVEAVEGRHYPDQAGTARPVPFRASLRMGLGSAWRAIAINALLSPLYLLLLFTGVGTPIAFFLVNSWLLGRDLGEMVAARHMDRAEMAVWRAGTRLQRFGLGAMATALFFVPIVNIVAPVMGAAMATHLFHARRKAA